MIVEKMVQPRLTDGQTAMMNYLGIRLQTKQATFSAFLLSDYEVNLA